MCSTSLRSACIRRDVEPLVRHDRAICAIGGNTVVVVEHEEAIIRAADQVIEIGPGAGERGGQVVFQGTPAEMIESRAQPDRRFSGRPPRHSGKSAPPLPQPRLDSPGRRAGKQPAKHHRRVSARRVVRRHRRQRGRQEHAGAGHALSGPAPADAPGGRSSRALTTTSTATAN